MGRLLQFPQVLRQTRDGCGWIEHDFRTVQAQCPCAFGKVAVITDVYAHFAISRIKNGISKVARLEKEFLPEPGYLWNVVFAVLAEIFAIRIDDSRRVVMDARDVLFIDRHDNDHVELSGIFTHQLSGWPIRNGFSGVIPLCILGRAEIRTGENFLETQHLYTLFSSFGDVRDVRLYHRAAVFFHRCICVELVGHLDNAGFHYS